MFSKQVILYSVKSMPDSRADFDMYLIEKDLDGKIRFSPDLSIIKKKVKITEYLIENPGIKDNFGNEIVTNIVQDMVKKLCTGYDLDLEEIKDRFDKYPNLYNYLRFDGYDIDFNNGKLIRVLPDNTSVEKKEDNILDFLKEYGFKTTKGHYEQAKGSYLSNNLAALNGQLRTFTESLFKDMANYIKEQEDTNQNITNICPENAITSMQILAKCSHPILTDELNEWKGDGKGYIQMFWNRLHPQGSHPGIPTLDEAVYRFQLVVLNVSYLINCFKKFY